MSAIIRVLTSGAEHIRAQAEIEAKRTVQKARNENSAAQSALANFTRALTNKRAMDAAGSEIGALTENIGRNLDAATYGTLSRRVQAAEELGAISAAAAAAGVGGSTIEQFSRQVMATEDRMDEQAARAVNSDLYLASSARGDTIRNAVMGLDNSQSFANLDFTKYVDHQKMSGFSKFLAITGAAAATYFGGPQAGEAVASGFMAAQDMRNGDFNAGAAGFSNMVQGLGAGAKNYADRDEPWVRGLWSSTRNLLNDIRL